MHQAFKIFQNFRKQYLRSFGTLIPRNCAAENSRILHSSRYRMGGSQGKPPFTVCVEGNIGCGKTTFLNYFSRLKDVGVFHEPVDRWTNMKTFNLMELMYKDPSRWSHLFQSYVQLTMIELHVMPCYKHTKIMERSLYSARYCFVEHLFRSKKMSEPEYLVYCEWFKTFTTILDCKVDLTVYLRTDPSVLGDRIRARNRKEEIGLPLDYLRDLHELHEEWLIINASKNSTPILVIDANGTLQQMQELYMKHRNQIVYGHTYPPPKGLLRSPNKSKKKRQNELCPKSAAIAN